VIAAASRAPTWDGRAPDQGGQASGEDDRLSCHRFRSNEVRLWLSVMAYNLGNLWRRLVLPRRIGNWSLTSLQQRLVKTGGRLVKHARYDWLLLAESGRTRRLFWGDSTPDCRATGGDRVGGIGRQEADRRGGGVGARMEVIETMQLANFEVRTTAKTRARRRKGTAG
jgi:Transposase DDE domain group 1